MSMKRRRKTTYISGPIIGWPAEEVIEKFEHTEQLIRDRGEVPINPLKLCNLNMTYEECMRKDITVMLLQADKIYMIAGYETATALNWSWTWPRCVEWKWSTRRSRRMNEMNYEVIKTLGVLSEWKEK